MTIAKKGRPEVITQAELQVIQKVRGSARSNRRKFIETFLYIKNKDRQMQRLSFNPSQEVAWKYIEEELAADHAARLIFLKGRQVGMTTLTAGLVFSEVYNNDNTDAIVMAHLKERTMKLFQMYHLMLKNLPVELQLPLSRSSRMELVWEHTNSGISLATAGTTSFGRGGTVPIVHASEGAYYGSLYETLGALEPSIPDRPGSIVIVESTASGVGNEFHHLWNAAVSGDNDFRAVFIPWMVDDQHLKKFRNAQERDTWRERYLDTDDDLISRMNHYGLSLAQTYWYWWYRKNKLHGDDLLMQQEFPCDALECFISSGSPVFSPRQLVDYKKGVIKGKRYDARKPWTDFAEFTKEPDKIEPYRDAYVEIWNTPATGRKYIISADTAEGVDGGDYSCAYIFDALKQTPVAVVHGRIEPHEYARLLAKLGVAYNHALIAPEIHGVGIALLAKLRDIYHNIYQWKVFDGHAIVDTNKLGWETNISSRKIMITNAKYNWSNSVSTPHFIPDEFLLEEIQRFVYTGLDMKAQAGAGFHDDRVMAWMIGLIVCAQESQYLDMPGVLKADDIYGGSMNLSQDELIKSRTSTNFMTGETLSASEDWEYADYGPSSFGESDDYDLW